MGLAHDNENFTVTDGRLTVDISGLAGVAEVTWPGNCAPSGTTAVCTVPQVPVTGSDYSPQVRLEVRAADGAQDGAHGRITYAATAVGGPDGTLEAPGTPSTRRSPSAPARTSSWAGSPRSRTSPQARRRSCRSR